MPTFRYVSHLTESNALDALDLNQILFEQHISWRIKPNLNLPNYKQSVFCQKISQLHKKYNIDNLKLQNCRKSFLKILLYYIYIFRRAMRHNLITWSFHFSRASLNQLISPGGGGTLNNYINIFIMKKKNKAREKKEVLANLSILYCIGGVDWYLLYLSFKKV